jgi:hypothetical protein
MLGAFMRASQADFAAHAAKMSSHFTVAGHRIRSQTTDGCAICIERNAALHHFYVVFLEASGQASAAGDSTSVACVDASLIAGMNMYCSISDSLRCGRCGPEP